VQVEGVSKRFRIYRERNQSLKAALMRGGRRSRFDEFWALRDVSFDIPKGSTFGLIGANGSGKSTMLKCIAKILRPDHGQVVINGSLAALLELGSGFHPELSGRENIYLNGSILGLQRSDIEARFDEIVDFSGISAFIDQPVKNYSSGMYVRLGFSIAINVEPDVLLVDEVLAVGDANFQDKCMEKFADFRRSGKTVVLVSHALGSMRSLCDEVAWLEHGRLTSLGDAVEVVAEYVDSSHEHATEETTTNGAVHYGSGEVLIESLQLLDTAGDPTTDLAFGEGFHVKVAYKTREHVERPVIGLGIETSDGHMMWGSNTREGGIEIDRIDGSGVIDFVVPRLPFQGQHLALIAVIADHSTTHVFDSLRGEVYFNISSARPIESGGPVALGGRWNHTAVVDNQQVDNQQRVEAS
jgi:ABC-2 type transport system ATP-binding protein